MTQTGSDVNQDRDARRDATAPRPRHGFANPYVQIAIGALLVTASELLLKKGATAAPHLPGPIAWVGVSALASAWTWGGIVCYLLSFASWLYVLRLLPLSTAFALINVVHVLVPVSAWALLHEHVSMRQWSGITLVLFGIALVARPVAHAEERL